MNSSSTTITARVSIAARAELTAAAAAANMTLSGFVSELLVRHLADRAEQRAVDDIRREISGMAQSDRQVAERLDRIERLLARLSGAPTPTEASSPRGAADSVARGLRPDIFQGALRAAKQ